LNKNLLRRSAKPLLGLAILGLLIAQLDFRLLREVVLDVDIYFFSFSLLSCVLANVLCALRWQRIAEIYGLKISVREALTLYFQGVSANTVLPGGIVGGDVWRTIGLVRKNFNKLDSARSVLLDRASGLWALSLISSAALVISWVSSDVLRGLSPALVGFYGFGLAAIVSSVFLGLFASFRLEGNAVFRTKAISIVSQILFIVGFWCCLQATGAEVDPVISTAACAAIFLGAVVPASVGGFGSREFASVFVLGFIGVSQEAGFVASVLFGLTATIQGIAFLPLVFRREG
jgi:glycosyltransferase 2 family protein